VIVAKIAHARMARAVDPVLCGLPGSCRRETPPPRRAPVR
jgi:hypothetical protein